MWPETRFAPWRAPRLQGYYGAPGSLPVRRAGKDAWADDLAAEQAPDGLGAELYQQAEDWNKKGSTPVAQSPPGGWDDQAPIGGFRPDEETDSQFWSSPGRAR